MKRILTIAFALIISLTCVTSVAFAQKYEYTLGDVNGNGEIDSMDYVLLKRAYFGTYDFNEDVKSCADINENGEIDTMDYVLLKRAYFGTYRLIKQENNYNDPPEAISVRGLAQLSEMRSMLKSSDEELEIYLRSVEGGGADSRADIEYFLAIIDSVPFLEVIDGEISWISLSPDSDVLYITTKASNGDWIRLEYHLSMDPSVGVERFGSDKSVIYEPVKSKDGRVTAYSQVKEAHPSGKGNTIELTLTVDDILVYAVYYTSSDKEIKADFVCNSDNLTQISAKEIIESKYRS